MLFILFIAFVIPLVFGYVADSFIFNRKKKRHGWNNAGSVVAVSAACACIMGMILYVAESI